MHRFDYRVPRAFITLSHYFENGNSQEDYSARYDMKFFLLMVCTIMIEMNLR